jgi:hypothetical protein
MPFASSAMAVCETMAIMGPWAVVVAALVGLAGTAIGLYLGHRRWAQERREAQSDAFRQKRRAAYEGLWAVTESLHLEIRAALGEAAERGHADPLTDRGLRSTSTRLNEVLIQEGVWFDRQDDRLARKYVDALLKLASFTIDKLPDLTETAADMGATMDPPRSSNEFMALYGNASDAREALRARIRDVLASGGVSEREDSGDESAQAARSSHLS